MSRRQKSTVFRSLSVNNVQKERTNLIRLVADLTHSYCSLDIIITYYKSAIYTIQNIIPTK